MNVEIDQKMKISNLPLALTPSAQAWMASSPGKRSLTAVWTSLQLRVAFLFLLAIMLASLAIRWNRSLTKEFIMLIAFEEIVLFGRTSFKSLNM